MKAAQFSAIAMAVLTAFANPVSAKNLSSAENTSSNSEMSATAAMSSTEMTLCANLPIPDGWVVTNITNGCGVGVGLYYLNKLDQNQMMNMCAVMPVPAGWIVENIRGGCMSGIPNYEIRFAKKGNYYKMCRVPGSFIPENWVVTLVQ